MAKRVFITGGTGFIGRALVRALRQRGDEVIVLSRNSASARGKLSFAGDDGDGIGKLEIVEGDPNYSGAWQEALGGTDAVINLAGQSVASKRWTARFKQILHDSRVESTRYLVEGIEALKPDARPAVLVSASGIDYYPFDVDLSAVLPVDEDDDVDESTPSGSSFLARLCRNWEAEAVVAEKLDVRVVLMRTGLVLGPDEDGPLDKMTTPFRFFVGGRIGNGRQWMCWIHLVDAVRAYLLAIDSAEVSGPLNLAAPNPVRADVFAKALGKAMSRPSWMPVPGFAIKAAVGEFAEYILNGRRAVPRALLDHGFEFEFTALEPALGEIFAG